MSDTRNETPSDNPDDLLAGHLYKLVGKKPVPCTLEEYVTGMKSAANRIIEQNQVGQWLVSTIFTGIDHAFGNGEKQLFETKIFGLPDELEPRWLFASWNQAVRHHRKMVIRLETEGADSLIAEIRQHQS